MSKTRKGRIGIYIFIFLFIHNLSGKVIFLSHFNDGIYGINKNGEKIQLISIEGKITDNKSGFPFQNSIPSPECLDLTGQVGCVKIPIENNFNLNEGTIMFWVKLTWAGTDRLGYYTFFKIWHDWKHRFMIMKSEKSSYIYFYVTNPNFIEGEWGIRKDISEWQPGEWHHIAVSYFYSKPESQTGIGCLYVDGKLIVKSYHLKRILSLPQYMEIGFDNKYYAPKAYIDEFVIFDRALNEKEIENLYKMMIEEKKEISLNIDDKEERMEKLVRPKTENNYGELKIPKIPKRNILIDGNLNEKYWANSLRVSDFYLYRKKEQKSKVETQAYLLYDEDYLYIGFICDEPNMNKIVANVKEKDASVWIDDCIEILIDPEKDVQNYWHIIINSTNTIYDAKSSDPKFDIKGLLSGVKKGDNFWSVEVAIPFKEISKTIPSFGDKWGLKLCRERKIEYENLAYPYQEKPFDSYTGFADFKFGEMISEGEINVHIKGDKLTLGWNEISINLEEKKNQKREIIIKIFKNTFYEKNILMDEKKISLNPSEKKEIVLEIPLKEINISDVLLTIEGKGAVFYFEKFNIEGKDVLERINQDIREIKKLNALLPERKDTFYNEIKNKIKNFEEKVETCFTEIENSLNKKVKIGAAFIKNLEKIDEEFKEMRKYLGLIVWIPKDIWEKFSPESVPETFSYFELPSLKISGAKNEYESAAICLLNLLNPENQIRVIIEDFKNEKGEIFSSENIKVRELIWIRDMNKGLKDDPLIENDLNLFTIPFGKMKIIWLTFYIPNKAASGIYKGKIKLKPLDTLQEEFVKEIPVEIKIRNFALPEENVVDVYFWHSAYTVIPMEFLVSSIKNRKEHRINWIMCEAWWARGLKYDFSIWKEFFEECKKNKVKIMFGFGVNDANFVEKVVSILEQQHGFKKDEYAFQFFADEFGEDRLEKAIEFGKEIKNRFPDTKWMMDIANNVWKGENFKLLEKLFPYVDIITNSFSRVYPPDQPQAKFEIEFLRKNKKIFWTYKCSTKMISQPILDYYRITPWQNWKIGSDGFAYWTYACFLEDPLDMFDLTTKGYGWDEGIVYYAYGKDKKIVIDTKRYEALREGIEDYHYLYLLKKKIEERKKMGLNTSNEEVVLNKAVDEVLKEKTSDIVYKWREIIGNLIESFEK
ncbi:MAG: DUF4091 domain-containing protein [Candidatus Omnitrophica bacterium]|nr:DUF4091 domain-containing protein [Candidatus Omnitrophota bacterium]